MPLCELRLLYNRTAPDGVFTLPINGKPTVVSALHPSPIIPLSPRRRYVIDVHASYVADKQIIDEMSCTTVRHQLMLISMGGHEIHWNKQRQRLPGSWILGKMLLIKTECVSVGINTWTLLSFATGAGGPQVHSSHTHSVLILFCLKKKKGFYLKRIRGNDNCLCVCAAVQSASLSHVNSWFHLDCLNRFPETGTRGPHLPQTSAPQYR